MPNPTQIKAKISQIISRTTANLLIFFPFDFGVNIAILGIIVLQFVSYSSLTYMFPLGLSISQLSNASSDSMPSPKSTSSPSVILTISLE